MSNEEDGEKQIFPGAGKGRKVALLMPREREEEQVAASGVREK